MTDKTMRVYSDTNHGGGVDPALGLNGVARMAGMAPAPDAYRPPAESPQPIAVSRAPLPTGVPYSPAPNSAAPRQSPSQEGPWPASGRPVEVWLDTPTGAFIQTYPVATFTQDGEFLVLGRGQDDPQVVFPYAGKKAGPDGFPKIGVRVKGSPGVYLIDGPARVIRIGRMLLCLLPVVDKASDQEYWAAHGMQEQPPAAPEGQRHDGEARGYPPGLDAAVGGETDPADDAGGEPLPDWGGEPAGESPPHGWPGEIV